MPALAPDGAGGAHRRRRPPLSELLGAGPNGPTWKTLLADGTLAAAKRVTAPGEEGDELLARLARGSDLREAGLVPVLSAFREGQDVWIVSELDEGVPLTKIGDRLRQRRALIVAVGLAALDGLTALHKAGLWHGAMRSGNLHLGRDGSVRLSGYAIVPLIPEEPERSLRAADVRAVGQMLCSLLGVPAAAGKTPRIAATPLGVAARAMATSIPRKRTRGTNEASQARLSLWEAAGRTASRKRQAEARLQLAELVSGAPSRASVSTRPAENRPLVKKPRRRQLPRPRTEPQPQAA